VKRKIDKKNEYLSEHPRASLEVALRDINREIKKRKLVGIIEAGIAGRSISYEINNTLLDEAGRLDGCYVIRTNVLDLGKEIIHDRYKDLFQVEQAFKTMKTRLEEIRPIYVMKEGATRGHVFVCMLGYMVAKYMWDELKELGFTQGFIFETLDRIQYIRYNFRDIEIKVLPNELLEHQSLILGKLGIKLPHQL